MCDVEKIYNLKIICSGSRLEIYKFNNYALRDNFEVTKNKNDISCGAQLNFDELQDLYIESYRIEEMAKINRNKTLRKSKNNIIRLIQSNPDMTTFLTLTFAVEHNYKNSKKELNNFFNKLRRKFVNLKYLWVMEYGAKRKRLHFHILTNIFNKLELHVDYRKSEEHKKFETWFMNKYWRLGFVDIRDFKTEDNINIALYVSKYITKALEDINMNGYRIYGYSHKTLIKPVEIKCYSKDSISELLKMFDNYKLKYQNSYEVGFHDWKGTRKGICTYLDLELKENK